MSLERLYLITLNLLIIHQIDAAYWNEWDMFLLPGGIQVYLLFNIVVIPVVIVGYKHVLMQTSHAQLYSYLCAGLAVVTFVIHALFALYGAEQFNLPMSISIIVLCLLSGGWQLLLTQRAVK